MHFTKEDYNKIEQWLRRNSVKDTEFPKAARIQQNDNITIIQDGENKQVSLSELIQYLDLEVGKFPVVSGEGDYSIVSVSDIGPNVATGKYSSAFGKGTINKAPSCTVVGKFNQAEANSLFAIGMGQSDTDRKNLLVGDVWGNIYIYGIGEYQGVYGGGYQSLQKTIKNIKSSIDKIPEKNPIDKGEAENSVILKGDYEGYSNRAISQTSMAVGAATLAGLKGWYYSSIDFSENRIKISERKVINTYGVLSGGYWSSSSKPNIEVGDVISIVNDSKYDLCSKVVGVNGEDIYVDSLPFSNIVSDGIYANLDDNSIYIPAKPDAGVVDFGGGALSEGGHNTMATNLCAHAEGLDTHAYGQYSHTEGRETKAGYACHAEGRRTWAKGTKSHSEGYQTIASGEASHTEGYSEVNDFNNLNFNQPDVKLIEIWKDNKFSLAKGKASHSEGLSTLALSTGAHAEGYRTIAEGGEGSHSEGYITHASGKSSHAEGRSTYATNTAAHAEGAGTYAEGAYSHAEGNTTFAKAWGAHSEGQTTKAEARFSHAEGYKNNVGESEPERTELNTTELGLAAHAEGQSNLAKGNSSHAEGLKNNALGRASHAEGQENTAKGNLSHAEGYQCQANGGASHATGFGAETTNENEFACGRFNKSTESDNTAEATLFSVGSGTRDVRKNVLEVKKNGDVYIEGIGGTLQNLLNSLNNTIASLNMDLADFNQRISRLEENS